MSEPSSITAGMIERAVGTVHRKMADEAENKLTGKERRAAASRHLRRWVDLSPGTFTLCVTLYGALLLGVFALGLAT